VIGDPIEDLHPSLKDLLLEEDPNCDPVTEAPIAANIPWQPHLLEQQLLRAWYYHFEEPEGDSWFRRALHAKNEMPDLQIGIAADEETLRNESFLMQCVELDASLAVIEFRRGKPYAADFYGSVTEYVCARRITLSRQGAKWFLDMLLARAEEEPKDQRKGVLLEVLCAALMSQVENFEPKAKGVSNRTQQMDVLVHNKNQGGALGGSPVVLVEAKNWPKKPVGPPEYAIFIRKMQTRHGRCRLGFIVTIGRFTRNVSRDRLRDSKDDELVILIDGKELPRIWRGRRPITEVIEQLALDATIGE
jgi:hypothetical protein